MHYISIALFFFLLILFIYASWVFIKKKIKSKNIHRYSNCNVQHGDKNESIQISNTCNHEWKLYNYSGKTLGTCIKCKKSKIFCSSEENMHNSAKLYKNRNEKIPDNIIISGRQLFKTKKTKIKSNEELIKEENERREKLQIKIECLTSELYNKYVAEGKQHTISLILAKQEARARLGCNKNTEFTYDGAVVKDPLAYLSGTAVDGRILE